MAGAGGTTPSAPLRLKDLLELDCDSCSAAGFRCYPRRLVGESASAPMRHLLDSPSLSLRRQRTSSKLSHLSRSLSRRLSRRGGFWSSRRRDDDDAMAATATATATARAASEELETSSECSDNSSGRTSRRSRSDSDSVFSSTTTEASEDSAHHRRPSQPAAAGDEHEVAMKRVMSKEGSSSSGSEADDKEQLSPVAVMDFPFDDDEDDDELRDAGVACSPPSFSLARLQRRKTHKIRRFGSHSELTPLDLDARLAATSDPDSPAAAAVPPQAQQMIQCRRTEDAATPTCAGSGQRGAGRVHDVPEEDDGLISLLTGVVSAGLDDASSERLLLDFVVEMKSRRRSEAHAEAELLPLRGGPAATGDVLQRKAERVVDGEAAVAAAAARGWLEEGTGTERWGLADVLSGGAAILAEMERDRRWMQVGEEQREVGSMVAGMLVDQLVLEVVRCLFV